MLRATACALSAAIALGLCVRVASALEGDYEGVSTRIPVKLTARLSSQDAAAGDRFTFDTTASAMVDAKFLPAGTHGHGIVRVARSARGPQPGVLTLEAQSLDPVGIAAIRVGLAPGSLDVVLHGDRRGYPASAGGFPIGGDSGTNVVYEKGTAFTVIAPPPETPAPDASPGT